MNDEKYRLPLKSEITKVLKRDFEAVPIFSPAMAKLLEIFTNDKASIKDLTLIVKTDPGLSTKVLSVVNHAFYGQREKVTDLKQAVLLLGFDEIKRLFFEITFYENIIKSEKENQFNKISFWRHCLCVAFLCKAIAKQIDYPSPEEAYICGLLHDFGKIIFDLEGRVNYDQFIENVAGYTRPIVTKERELMGMGHDDLGAYFSALFNLPNPVWLSIKYHHRRFGHLDFSADEAMLISITSLANFLSWTQGMGSYNIISPPLLQPEVEDHIDITHIDFKSIIGQMDRGMEITSQFYNFIFPSPNEFRENLLKANLKLCNFNKTYFDVVTADEAFQSEIDMSQFHDCLTAPHRSLDPSEIIKTTLQAIHIDFHFQRLYVMRILKSLRILKVTECFNAVRDNVDLKSIEFSINKKSGGFVECLRTKKLVVINGKSPGEKEILDKFQINEMIIVPFCSHEKVIGILGMDSCAVSGMTVQPDILGPIAVITKELGIALENAKKYNDAKVISLRDGLTGLLNRKAMDDLLATSFRKAVDGNFSLSVVMIDVDFFKKVNDNFGHQTGDNVLKIIASVLKKISRPSDHIGRYGGEEFIVILNNTNLAQAVIYSERLRMEIENVGKLLKNRFPGISLTASAGVSEYHCEDKTPETLIDKADKALYRAKETGRNKVVAG